MPVSISGAGSISGLDQGFNVTTGSVGVGTTNPRTDLQVGAFGGGDSNIQLATGTSGASNILFGDGSAGSDYYKGFIKYNHSTDNLELYTTDDIIQYTGGTERLRITSDGQLNLAGNMQFTAATPELEFNNGGPRFRVPAANTLTIHTGGGLGATSNERLRITSAGNISVGSNNPNGLLALTASSGRILTLRNSTTGSASGDGSYLALNGLDFQIANAEAANVILYTADTERLRITSGGNIGIGTDNPNKILKVEYPDPGSGSNGLTQKDTGNDTTTFFGTVGPSYNYIGHSGHAGMVYSSRDLAIGVDQNNSGVIKFYTGSAERTRIKSNGHIHIGNPIELANVATTTHTFALSGNSDNTFPCPGSVAISGATAYNTANYAGGGLRFLGKYNASGQYTTFGHVGGIKENTTDGNYAGALTFHTRNHGGLGAERMRISSNGQVTMPSQPCFWATSNTGGSDTTEGYTGSISTYMEAAYVNIGNHYNTSTGIFTCPVAGTYEFHGQGLIRYQTGVGRAELSFYKNGSNTISRSYGYTYITGTNDHDNLHVMAYITCAVNDQIDLRVYAMDSGIDCYFAQGLGYFSGRLVQ